MGEQANAAIKLNATSEQKYKICNRIVNWENKETWMQPHKNLKTWIINGKVAIITLNML